MTSQLLKMIGVAVLVCGAIYAAPSSASEGQAASKSPTAAIGGHSFEVTHRNRVGQSPTTGVKHEAFIYKKSINSHALPIGTPSFFPFGGRLPKNVRFRGPGLAIVGGPSSKSKTTASIDGTQMSRKW
jgi:hypothetical protein